MTERVPDILLLRYLAGDLSPSEAKRIESLSQSLPDVLLRLNSLREEQAAFLAQDPPELFAHRVMVQVGVQQAHAQNKRRGWMWLAAPWSAAALGLLFAVTYARMDAKHPSLDELAGGAPPAADGVATMPLREEQPKVAQPMAPRAVAAPALAEPERKREARAKPKAKAHAQGVARDQAPAKGAPAEGGSLSDDAMSGIGAQGSGLGGRGVGSGGGGSGYGAASGTARHEDVEHEDVLDKKRAAAPQAMAERRAEKSTQMVRFALQDNAGGTVYPGQKVAVGQRLSLVVIGATQGYAQVFVQQNAVLTVLAAGSTRASATSQKPLNFIVPAGAGPVDLVVVVGRTRVSAQELNQSYNGGKGPLLPGHIADQDGQAWRTQLVR